MKKSIWLAVVPLALFVVLTVQLSPIRAEQKVNLNDLPKAVRDTIEKQAGQHEIREIVLDDEEGEMRYEAEVIIDGEEVDILVSLTGEYLGVEGDDHEAAGAGGEEEEESLRWEDLPQSVQDAFTNAAPGVPIAEIVRETENGAAYYELEYTADGVTSELKVTEDGYVVEYESVVAAADLPPAVLATLQSKFAGAAIAEAEAVTLTYYDITIEQNGAKSEIRLLANGHALDDDDDEVDDDDDDE